MFKQITSEKRRELDVSIVVDRAWSVGLSDVQSIAVIVQRLTWASGVVDLLGATATELTSMKLDNFLSNMGYCQGSELNRCISCCNSTYTAERLAEQWSVFHKDDLSIV